MPRMSNVIVLVVALALLAASAFAATPVAQPQIPGATAPRVSTTAVNEIFSPLPSAQPAAAVFLIRGVCNLTCQPCFGTCPVDPDTGRHQICVGACP